MSTLTLAIAFVILALTAHAEEGGGNVGVPLSISVPITCLSTATYCAELLVHGCTCRDGRILWAFELAPDPSRPMDNQA
jgi:hypothetical protein